MSQKSVARALNKIAVCAANKAPRSNTHGRKRPYTEKYDDLHDPVLRSYISVSYTEKYGDKRRRKRSFMILVYGVRIRFPFHSVFLRIRSRRKMIVILDYVIRQNTVVYDRKRNVYGVREPRLWQLK